MASLCGNKFMKKIRHGCFSGSAMYSPDVYIMTKKSSRRPKKKRDDSHGFHDNWARDNEAMENDSCYVYDGDKKPKKLNLVESMVIEEDCSWFTPRSCQSLPKPTNSYAAKSVDKWKTPKSIETVESNHMTSNQTGSLRRGRGKKQSTADNNPYATNERTSYTPRLPLKHIQNGKQITCTKSPLKSRQHRGQMSGTKTPLKGIQNRKQTSCTKTPLKDIQNRKQMSCSMKAKRKPDQIVNSLINKNPKAVHFNKVNDNKKVAMFQKIQTSNVQHISNDIHEDNKPPQSPVVPPGHVVSRHTKQDPKQNPTCDEKELSTYTKVTHAKHSDPVQPSFIGIINGPKPHVVLSETVKKNNIKGRRMFCGNLPEKTSLFVEETLPAIEDQQMSIDELETTKLMQEHALKEPILPSCDESVAISSHLKLTMSVASDATSTSTMKSSAVEDSMLSNSKQSCHFRSRPPSTDSNMTTDDMFTDVSSKGSGDTSMSATLTDVSSMGATLTDVTLTDVTSMGSSVFSMGTTFTNVTSESLTDASSMVATLPDACLAGGGSSKEMIHPTASKRSICLPSYVTDDNHLCESKYCSPTLVQLKMRKQRSVAKLVKAFEHLDCKKATINLFDEVQTTVSTEKQIEDNMMIPDDDIKKNITDVNIKGPVQVSSQDLASQKDSKCQSMDLSDNSIKPEEQLEIGMIKTTGKSDCIEKEIYFGECIEMPSLSPSVSTTCQLNYEKVSQPIPRVKQEDSSSESKSLATESVVSMESNKGKESGHQIPEKLSRLWSAVMLDDYTSKDFSVGQGNEVIVMNEDHPKWLYVQIATAVNGQVNLKRKTAGFVPRSLVLPRFASPATRSSYRSLDSRKKSKNVCNHHVRMSSDPMPFDPMDNIQMQNKKSSCLVKQLDQDFQDYEPIQHSQSLPTNSLLIESYIVLDDHKPKEKDEVEVLAGEVIVVHAGQQQELDWMWVYVPRAEKFGYIPAFCATPMALESQKSNPMCMPNY